MSHQDRDGRTSFPFHFQALNDAFLWLLKGADLSPIQFRGDCTWSPLGLIFTALLWSWSDEKTLQDRFSTARKICFKAFRKGGPRTGSRQGARRVVSGLHEDVADLDGQSRARVDGGVSGAHAHRLPDRLTIAGFEVFAVDGSRLEVPRTESNESRFSPRSTQKRRHGKGAKRRKPARAATGQSVPAPRKPTAPRYG